MRGWDSRQELDWSQMHRKLSQDDPTLLYNSNFLSAINKCNVAHFVQISSLSKSCFRLKSIKVMPASVVGLDTFSLEYVLPIESGIWE